MEFNQCVLEKKNPHLVMLLSQIQILGVHPEVILMQTMRGLEGWSHSILGKIQLGNWVVGM